MMNSLVMKMLRDAHMVGIRRQIEHQRVVEKADYQRPRVLALAALLMAAVFGSGWIA